MTSGAEKKGGMPTWAKVLIGVFVLGSILVVGGLACLMWVAVDAGKKATDPVQIAKIRSEIADIQDPLPGGFVYHMGMSLMGIRIIEAEDRKDGLGVTLMMLPMTNDKKTGDQLADDLAAHGVPSQGSSNPSTQLEVTSKGAETVGGEQMPYRIGTMTLKSGKRVQAMVGALITKDKKTIMFLGQMNTTDTPYNLKATEEFLGAIKSFNAPAK